MPTWKEDIVAALELLGGEGSYEEIYAEVAARRENLPREWQATIRGAIETASSNSNAFRPGGDDRFYSVAGIGQGIWGLRGFAAAALPAGAGVAQNPDAPQGFVADSVIRRAIEEYALDAAEEHYGKTATGEIKRLGKPYDLCVPLRDGEMHIEVKGSTRDLGSVILTTNEVTHARTTEGSELYVVDRIRLSTDQTGEARLTGGRRRWWTKWVPREEALTPTVYLYALPEPTGSE